MKPVASTVGGPARSLIDVRLDQPLQVLERFLPAEITGLDGNASSETAKNYGDRARVLAELGWSLVKDGA